MGISRKSVDKRRAQSALDTAATFDFLERWAQWIVAQDHPPVVYGAYQRHPSSNLPRPLLGMVLQDGAGVDHWNIGGVTHGIKDQQAVILSCAQGSQAGPFNPAAGHAGHAGQTRQSGGLWICSFDVTHSLDTPAMQALLRDYAFAPFNVTQMPALRQAYLQLFACKQRNDISPCAMHLKAAWLQLLALLQDELRDDSNRVVQQKKRKHSRRNTALKNATSAMNVAATTSRLPPESIARAMDHIHQHYAFAAMTQQTLARAACLDPHHFGRLFKASVGQTPMRYLRQTRLRQAAFLLTNTSKNIAAITYEVGLSEPQHFARIFREMYHASPTAYRQTAGEGRRIK